VQAKAEDGFNVKAAADRKSDYAENTPGIREFTQQPCGGVVDPEEFQRILALCKKHRSG